MLLQTYQAPLWRAHQIMHRRASPRAPPRSARRGPSGPSSMTLASAMLTPALVGQSVMATISKNRVISDQHTYSPVTDSPFVGAGAAMATLRQCRSSMPKFKFAPDSALEEGVSS